MIRSSKLFESFKGDDDRRTAFSSDEEEVSREDLRETLRGLFSVESRSLVVTSLPFESVLRSRILLGGRGQGEKLLMGLVMDVFLGEGITGLTMRDVSPGIRGVLFKRAFAVDPNNKTANSGRGSFRTFLGDGFDEALSLEEETSQA